MSMHVKPRALAFFEALRWGLNPECSSVTPFLGISPLSASLLTACTAAPRVGVQAGLRKVL